MALTLAEARKQILEKERRLPDYLIACVGGGSNAVGSADFLEIGLPYSDPLADGPTIQAADQRALKSGMNTDRVFEFVREIRKFSDIPITLLVYANLVYRRGMEKFYADAKEASVDGILIPDLPAEETAPYVTAAIKYWKQ